MVEEDTDDRATAPVGRTRAVRALGAYELIRYSYHPLPTFYTPGDQGTERLSGRPKVTQLQVEEPGFELKLHAGGAVCLPAHLIASPHLPNA